MYGYMYGTPCIYQSVVMEQNTLYTSEYGYSIKHPVYIRVWLWYGTLCIHQSMVMEINTLYTSEYGYSIKHPVYTRVVMLWNLCIHQSCYVMEHPVYIRVCVLNMYMQEL